LRLPIAEEFKMSSPIDMTSELIHKLQGDLTNKRCWYVNCGVADGSFSLALGERVRRVAPLTNENHTEEYREFEGEINVLVWCTWRSSDGRKLVASSDSDDSVMKAALGNLVGDALTKLSVDNVTWDLILVFRSGIILQLFCDQVDDTSSIDSNWEIYVGNEIVVSHRHSVCRVYSQDDEV
jgi:hypothetical protein